MFECDVSRWHNCHERELANRRLSQLLSDYGKCRFGCKSMPCMHDKWAEKPDVRLANEHKRVRPRMVEVSGKWHVVCVENSYSMASELEPKNWAIDRPQIDFNERKKLDDTNGRAN